MARELLYVLAIYSLSVLGCSVGESPTSARTPNADAPCESGAPQLHNLQSISDNIYCGCEPPNDNAFLELATLGIKCVVSVDGAQPDIENARKHGLRYVHIPIGYDGIEQHARLSLARLVRDAEAPFYIHCHHGRHRGPAAAAIACLAAGDIDRQGALDILERAGTGKNYAGLWRAVETYRVPASHAQLPTLVEVADVGSVATAMASIDRAFDILKQCRDANWTAPPNHPDWVPHQQALLLKEGLRESGRNLSDEFDQQFATWLAEAERVAHRVEEALTAQDTNSAAQGLQALAHSCARCHQRYRN